ncbi:pyridoxal phosphate-dependent aminotransferase [Nocardiopsis mangrovi]|uniref:Aminotransferase n=1 Tax=Nocardiopsis mangrovi TaxID=1179818 RepID=A0ABV9E2C7_9ACTN
MRVALRGSDDDPLLPPFRPWRFMLDVDEVNYDEAELVAYTRRGLGEDVVNLSSGINHVEPPEKLIRFALDAAADPLFWHDYDGPSGHLIGRAAIAAYERSRGDGRVAIDVRNVIVTAGASAALSLAAAGLRASASAPVQGSGPGALVPVPTFPLAGAALARCGFDITEVESLVSGRWLPTVDELIAAADDDTRVCYLNTFNNPSGEFYGEAELRRLVAWARDRKVMLLHDLVSSDVSASDAIPHLLSIADEESYGEGLVTIGSMSKARAVPGFRVGWLIADDALVTRLSRANELQAPSSPAFAAPMLLLDRLLSAATDGAGDRVRDGAAASGAPHHARADLSAALRRRWSDLHELLASYVAVMPDLARFLDTAGAELTDPVTADGLAAWRMGIRRTLAENAAVLSTEFPDLVADVPAWRGDFNTFVRIPGLAGLDHLATAHELFRRHGLQTLPAPAFGKDEAWWRRRGYHSRLSFAMPTPLWRSALGRLRRAVADLAP